MHSCTRIPEHDHAQKCPNFPPAGPNDQLVYFALHMRASDINRIMNMPRNVAVASALICVSLFTRIASGQQQLGPTSCTNQTQHAALISLYNTSGGPGWTIPSSFTGNPWLSFSPCEMPSMSGTSMISLPSHCCWKGVSCCRSNGCPPGVGIM